MMEIERKADISIEKLIEQLDEAGEEMDKGGINRIAGENLWFAVCRDMLLKMAKLEEKIRKLEEKIAELEETLVEAIDGIEEFDEQIEKIEENGPIPVEP